MNDFSELEAELKQLQPRAPSPELTRRVEQALQENSIATGGVLPRRAKFELNWSTLGFGLAAAAAILLLARANFDRPAASKKPRIAQATTASPSVAMAAAQSLVPDGVTRVVYRTSDEGLVYPANSSEPARRLRSQSRETLHWKDAGTGASLRVSYPTEEVELVPVSLSGQ